MPTRERRRTVVCGVDFSATGELALDHTLELAAGDASVEPHFVHVASAYGPVLRLELGDEVRTMTMDDANELLRTHVARRVHELRQCREVAFERAVTHIRVGPPAQEIAQLALDLDADLVVVGTHGRRGVRRLLLGSVAEAVLRMTHCPVYVVRPKHESLHLLGERTPLLPPCARCLQVRRETLGERLWCEEHAARRPSAEVLAAPRQA